VFFFFFYMKLWLVLFCVIAVATCASPPKYVLNLNLPPDQRWSEIVTPHTDAIAKTISVLETWIPSPLRSTFLEIVSFVGSRVDSDLGDYGQELRGIAQSVGVDLGDVVALNLAYELSALCTSIVTPTETGTLLHGRNLDFGDGSQFTQQLQNLTIQVEFQLDGQVVFESATYAGYVGILTGMKPQMFSVTVNTRYSTNPFENFIEAWNKNASIISFLVRDVLTNLNSFQDAVNALSNSVLVAPVYYTVGGASENEGVVLTRNWYELLNAAQLSLPSQWYQVQTNWDTWDTPLWWDTRRAKAIEVLNSVGRQNLSYSTLFEVLSTPPVLNNHTTYTAIMSASQSYFAVQIR